MTNKLNKKGPANTKNARQPCEVYSRVVGWLTPVKNWNLGKKEEWKSRVPFNVDKEIKKKEHQ